MIIVNDGSTDNSEQLMNEALKDYDKDINYIKLESNHDMHMHVMLL